MPDGSSNPDLVLGPLLRYVGETEATVWVETRRALRGRGAGPPRAHLHASRSTTTRWSGSKAWSRAASTSTRSASTASAAGRRPGSELPPSAIRTLGRDAPIDVCFGSCRVALPHEEPYVHSKDRHEDGKEYDALRVLAIEMARGEHDEWPEFLFLLGDQVYVDEGSPRTRERIRERRGTADSPGEEVTDYEEYSWLYEESWSDPLIRWLLSTVSVSMQWDDHDMSDDWNISRSWLEEMRQKSWWHGRATAGVMSYWVYQHLGNLSPRRSTKTSSTGGARQRPRDRGAARVRRRRRNDRGRDPLELLPRPRRHPGDLHGLAGRPGA